MTEDLAEFFDEAEFADGAMYVASGANAKIVFGIFEDGNVDALGIVEEVGPAFTCALGDLPDVAQGDAITIRDVDYLVRGSSPDGTGLVRLKLEQQ